jgi:hypothetical protein
MGSLADTSRKRMGNPLTPIRFDSNHFSSLAAYWRFDALYVEDSRVLSQSDSATIVNLSVVVELKVGFRVYSGAVVASNPVSASVVVEYVEVGARPSTAS